MSEIRRDKKGRRLLTGESQRKDGKYEYKYQDAIWQKENRLQLEADRSDSVPKGKRGDIR